MRKLALSALALALMTSSLQAMNLKDEAKSTNVIVAPAYVPPEVTKEEFIKRAKDNVAGEIISVKGPEFDQFLVKLNDARVASGGSRLIADEMLAAKLTGGRIGLVILLHGVVVTGTATADSPSVTDAFLTKFGLPDVVEKAMATGA